MIIACGKSEFNPDRDDIITNFKIVIKVLSDSTKNYDHIEKYDFYRTLPTFQEYILVDQNRILVEHFYPESKGEWIYTDYRNIDDVLKFDKIEFQVSLKDNYNRVEFKKEKTTDSLRPLI